MRVRPIGSGKGSAPVRPALRPRRGAQGTSSAGRTLSVEEFGEVLIRSGDLDPVYNAFAAAALELDQAQRWLMAYWMFYHAGVASWLSEQSQPSRFWEAARVAAVNTEPAPTGGRWPRGAERRHFRGPRCVRAVEWLSYRSPEDWVASLRGACPPSRRQSSLDYRQVMRRVMVWPLHGPWIAFKAADMLERCLGWPVSFDRDIGLIYTEPQEGLYLLAHDRGRDASDVYDYLLSHFGRLKAPPWRDRMCGPQEVETVLCKYKSYRFGYYYPGKDIKEVRHALERWGPTAQRALMGLPAEVT